MVKVLTMRTTKTTTWINLDPDGDGQPNLDALVNQVVLDGVLVEPPILRATPNGRSVLALELEHETLDSLSGQRTACHIAVVALDQLAEFGRSLKMGEYLRVTGRLDQRRWIREGKTRWGRMELVARQLAVRQPPSLPTP